MKKLLGLCLLGLAGCGTYSHQRPVVLSVIVDQNQTNLVVASETTSIKVFFQKLSGTKITSLVKDGDYSRRIGVGAFDVIGDADMLKALSELVAKSMIASQTGGMGIPTFPTNFPALKEQP